MHAPLHAFRAASKKPPRRSFVLLALALPALAHTANGQSPARPDAWPNTPVASVPQRPLPILLVNSLPLCTADELLLSSDQEGGNFNGMSHSGTLLILRNIGTAACRLVPLAQASLLDKDGRSLGPFSTTPPIARFMHPGPVVLPIAVAANAELTATLRWVSGSVFDSSLCLSPTTLVLKLGDLALKTSLKGTLCGDRTRGVSAELSRFAPDPVVQAR